MAVSDFVATSHGSYRGDGSKRDTARMYQGYNSSNGDQRSLFLFDYNAIRATLSGRVVTGVEIRLRSNHWHYNSGGTAILGTTGHTGIPGSWSAPVWQDRWRFHMGKPETKWISLGVGVGQEFQNGTTNGFTLGETGTTDLTYYGFFAGPQESDPPVLRIHHESANVAPDSPLFHTPSHDAVVDLDATNEQVFIDWTHRDPNGDPQAAYYLYLRRNSDGVVIADWDGTQWVGPGTARRVATSATSVTVPFTWTGSHNLGIATEDPGGLKGPYAQRTFRPAYKPTTTVTGPTGTQTSHRPTVTYSVDGGGVSPANVHVKVFSEDVFQSSGFNPATSATVWARNASHSIMQGSTAIGVDLDNHKAYRVYARSTNVFGLEEPWGSQFVEFRVDIDPYAPVIDAPQNGATLDLAAGFTLDWTNRYPKGGGSQSSFKIRRKTPTGSWQFWDGSGWGGTSDTKHSGSASAFSFRSGDVANGEQWTFSVAMEDAYGQPSPWSDGVTVTGTTAATVTVTGPPPTVTSTRPEITWSVYDPEGDPQSAYEVKVFTKASAEGGGFNPDSSSSVWESGLTASAGRSVTPATDLSNGTEYRVYVRVETGGILSPWAWADTLISLVPPAAPTVSATVEESGRVRVDVQGRDNLLSRDTAAARGEDWTAIDGSLDAGVPYESSASGYALLLESGSSTVQAQVTDLPAVEGVTYTAAARVVALNTARQHRVRVLFYSGGGALIGGEFSAFSGNGEIATVTVEAPEGTAEIRVRSVVSAHGSGEEFYVFDPVVRPGTGSEWTPGGMSGQNTATVLVNGDEAVRGGRDVALSGPAQAATVYDDEIVPGQPTAYHAIVRSTGAQTLTSLSAASGEVTWSPERGHLSVPGDAVSGTLVSVHSFDVTTRPARQGKFLALGRAEPIIVSGTRQLREGALTVYTRTRADREAVEELLTANRVLLLRLPADVEGEPGDAVYLWVTGDLPVERVSRHRHGGRYLTVRWTEQTRPEVE